jgi:predicted transcriptional regulator
MNLKRKPTEAELEILQILWEQGPCSVRYINDKLNESRDVGYTTTLKIMQIMLEKQLLMREIKDNKHIYAAGITKKEAQTVLIDRMVTTVFSGSASNLIMQALGNYKTSRKELEMIKQLINKLENEK